jgi:hypothetical protein
MRVRTPPLPHPLSLHHRLYLLYFQKITGPFAFKNVYAFWGYGAVFTYGPILKVSRLKIFLIIAILISTNIIAVNIFILCIIALILLLGIFSIHLFFRLEDTRIDHPRLFNRDYAASFLSIQNR